MTTNQFSKKLQKHKFEWFKFELRVIECKFQK